MQHTTLFFPQTLSAPSNQTHELKIWPGCFMAVEAGTKPFDVRENDRDFQVGDALVLREYEPESEQYTGRVVNRWISHVLQGGVFGVEAGWCVLGFAEHPPLPAGITNTNLW